MLTRENDAPIATRRHDGLAAGLRPLLSFFLTTGTAFIAVVCIHLGAGGIQQGNANVYPLQEPPSAELEFAPLTSTLDLEPARDLPLQPDTF
ncbi:MAG: hypothetical protein AAFS02_08495 [Pseudomonadota bacterium]